MQLLQDKVAIITGASTGIGRAAAKLFVRHGARVVVNARGREGLDSLASELGDGAVVLAGDVGDEGTHVQLVALARDRFGGLDVAFNNAGTLGPMQATTEVDARAWDDALRVNLTAAFFAAKHQIPALSDRGGGSLVFTSTFVGHTVGMPGMAAYSASKAGVLGLVQSLAAELGPRRIRVNAL
ncbi:MAG TPA: SDR family NAD(P)-dependent oxidoreductase, partial [Nannocystaceae bacterium]|nr:SDR family NAD(P)-dependent oxidoreductase [Nannocystaceae bacterium]